MNELINKIHCADCLDLMKDIPDKSIDMILCDLPYGTTACSWDTVIDFDLLWTQYKRIVKDNACICLFGSQPFTTDLIMSNRKWFKYEWIYLKTKGSGHLSTNFRPLVHHENICIFYKKQCKYNAQMEKVKITDKRKTFTKKNIDIKQYGKYIATAKKDIGERCPKSYMLINNSDKTKSMHPTQKPVKLFEYLIKTYTDENDIVLDNCAGSGTTAIASFETNRRFICIEKLKNYVDIAKKRLKEKQDCYSLLDNKIFAK